jgi:hypothetical protein
VGRRGISKEFGEELIIVEEIVVEGRGEKEQASINRVPWRQKKDRRETSTFLT